MKILAVDTTEQSCSVAIVEEQVPICEAFHMNHMTHSRTLMDMIVHMVENRAGIKIDDLDAFVVSCGPGSFTGLRIGISVVKGLAFATSKPSAGISSLDAIACQFFCSSVPVCVMMDAKRGEVYCAVYRFINGRLIQKSQEMVLSPEQAVDIAVNLNLTLFPVLEQELGVINNMQGKHLSSAVPEDGKTENISPRSVMFAGSGAVAFKPLIKRLTDDSALFAPAFQNFVRASSLAYMIFENRALLSLSPEAITPVYLRKSDAEINYDSQCQRFC